MNPRQRRGVILMALGLVVAAAVVVLLATYVNGVRSQVAPLTTVYRAAGPIEAYTPLDASNLEPVEVPQRWTSETSRLALGDLEGRRVGFPLQPGTVVSADMLVPVSDLSPTEREIAINVDAVTGVAGRVRVGDRVDIYATFADVPGLPAQVRVLVRDVRVVSVGGRQTITAPEEDGLAQSDVIPVSLALEPNDSLAVTFASEFAQEVRLVALPGDQELDRSGDVDEFDAGNLGGTALPQGVDPGGVPPLPPGAVPGTEGGGR